MTKCRKRIEIIRQKEEEIYEKRKENQSSYHHWY